MKGATAAESARDASSHMLLRKELGVELIVIASIEVKIEFRVRVFGLEG